MSGRLDDFGDWLASNLQAIEDSGDKRLRTLCHRAWILLSEHQDALLGDDELRDRLLDLVRSSEPGVWTFGHHEASVAGSLSVTTTEQMNADLSLTPPSVTAATGQDLRVWA